MARRKGSHLRGPLPWLAVLIVFVAYLIWALRAEEAFQVTHKKLEYTDSGVTVSGEIHNTAATAATVNVEVTFFDAQGRQLGKEAVTLHDLGAGTTAAFRTQPKMLADVKDYTIYVNTGRNMYGN
ncbi:MAG TPA: FxLYD domain-containing protein [Candidatus Binatia bacterium]|jgi:hypothetical protein|nr:FxLYD domain-containing protein [Candidatus Binatia bacterium]